MITRLIVNPRAGAGAAARKLTEVTRALQRANITYTIAETRAPGHATELAARARDDGVEVVTVMGGDGTLNEVAQAYLDSLGNPIDGPDLALLPAGTGGDFRRTFGLGSGVREAVERLTTAPPRPLDLGIVRLTAHEGRPETRAFINIASFGIAGHIDRIVNRSPKWMGGRAAFVLGTIRAMAVYENAPVVVRVDGTDWVETRVVNVAVANGQYFGGGMHVAPQASVSDGLFDVVVLGDFSIAGSMQLSTQIYRGRHLHTRGVKMTRGARVEARPARPGDEVLIDLDGEAPGRLPLAAHIAPAALRIRA